MIEKRINMHLFWWIIVSSANILCLTIFYQSIFWTDISTSVLIVGNILIGILVRNELILHFLYRLAVWISVQTSYGKYYINSGVHYIGGVHASCTTWGFLWLILDRFRQLGNPNSLLSMSTSSDPISIAMTSILFTLICIILLTAISPLRHRFHDTFEISHRYLGWTCLAILVLHQFRFQAIVALNQAYPLESLLANPVLLMIALMVFSVFLPWMSVQCFDRLSFTMYSPHQGVMVIKALGGGDVGSFARISLDGVEWHSFSVARTSFNRDTGQSEIQLIIGAAGDWTRNLIEKVERGKIPERLWVRRVKPPGFMFSINAYSRVVVIATGAGIAPVIPHVIENGHKLCIVWVGNNHKQTYGEEIFSLLDSHPRCNIYDTGIHGRPNVEQLAIQGIRDFQAQAVFCVSNQTLTNKVVQGCLSKGIPAYGATWDS